MLSTCQYSSKAACKESPADAASLLGLTGDGLIDFTSCHTSRNTSGQKGTCFGNSSHHNGKAAAAASSDFTLLYLFM